MIDSLFKDCSVIEFDAFTAKYFGRSKAAPVKADRWLRELSHHEVSHTQLFTLSGLEQKGASEPIVYTDSHGQWWTGRYIGSLTFAGVSIEIHPRFGMEFVANNIPLSNFIPVNIDASFVAGHKFIHYLQALLWLNYLTKAARHALPTVKQVDKHSSLMVRGRIDVRGTIGHRIKGQPQVASMTQSKQVHNPVTTAVVLAFQEIERWFPNTNLMHWLPDSIALRLQQMINVTPRHSDIPKPHDIKRIRLNSVTKAYKPLVALSMDILKSKGIQESPEGGNNQSLLLDVAELWEIYVLDVLREAAPITFDVSHGTYESEGHLLKSLDRGRKLGKLLPDYLVKQHNEVVGVADAKYKRLGDAPWMSPKRDDLYQMTAYLSKFSSVLNGSLLYPNWNEGEPESDVEKDNPWMLDSGQRINFISLPLVKSEAVEKVKKLDLLGENFQASQLYKEVAL
jgi:5-methylcytosine-specific restriction enzyme subunit McrC